VLRDEAIRRPQSILGEISGLGQHAGFGPVFRNASAGLPVLFAAVVKLVELDLLRLDLPLARLGLCLAGPNRLTLRELRKFSRDRSYQKRRCLSFSRLGIEC